MKKDDPKMAYYRSLLILTKKIEFELKNSVFIFQNFFRDLEEIHDFVHEIFPA
ncbi:hypothetical protein LEP1GSC124_1297 [Leptospira interrogans serovar Pyrogenes str. 200701872]|nr:hypothetical protein LEP1GSC124_1297 [Leptospira interrogans serovar Pyrogenes str. 200701872]